MTIQDGSLDHDPETLKRGVFAQWKAEHPDGTPEQFETEWAAMTNIRHAAGSSPRLTDDARWEKDAEILKHRFFEEWIAHRPGATRAQFEEEWSRVKADFGG